MTGWQRWGHLVLVTTGIMGLYFLFPVTRETDTGTIARAGAAVLVLVLLALGVVRQLKVHLDQTDRRIDGLIVTIMTVVAVFSFIFYALALHSPGQFDGLETRIDSLYFVAATMATIGYGDVHAAGQTARGLVLVLMVFNVVFVGTAVALMSSHIKQVATERMEERRHGREPQ